MPRLTKFLAEISWLPCRRQSAASAGKAMWTGKQKTVGGQSLLPCRSRAVVAIVAVILTVGLGPLHPEDSTVAFAQAVAAGSDVALVQDVTGSFAGEIDDARLADQTLLDCVSNNFVDAQMGLTTFSGFATQVVPVLPVGLPDHAANYDAMSEAISGLVINVGTGTHIGIGIESGTAQLDASPPRPGILDRAIVIVSDGKPNATAAAQALYPESAYYDVCGGHCTDSELQEMAYLAAAGAFAKGYDVYAIYLEQDFDPSAEAFFEGLVRGNGIFRKVEQPENLDDVMLNLCIGFTPNPTADAGPDQSVDEGSHATLDGSNSSDPQSDPLNFDWNQVTGTPVTLDLSDPLHPTFTTPSVNRNETLTFELIVDDGTNFSEPDRVDTAIINVNDPPVANAGDDATVEEGATAQLDGSNSSDPESDPLAFHWSQVAGTPVTLFPDNTATQPTFEAPLGIGEVLIFKLVVSDSFEASTPSPGVNSSFDDTVAITVVEKGPNVAPVAVNDSYSITRNRTLAVDANAGVLANDHDREGDPLSAQLDTPPVNGVVELSEDGSFIYMPNKDFTGRDAFGYRATDGLADSEIGTVIIKVNRESAPWLMLLEDEN